MKRIKRILLMLLVFPFGLTACNLEKSHDSLNIMVNNDICAEYWDTLSQVKFWHDVMSLPGNQYVINVVKNRRILDTLSFDSIAYLADSSLEDIKTIYREKFGLDTNERLYFTKGRKEFYDYTNLNSYLNKSKKVFTVNGVDPWYAKSILLIENPGIQRVSSKGAAGPFQLMRGVARKFGLVVNRKRDDRRNISKSSYAAAQLISTICIPYAKQFLEEKGIPYSEDELGFKLLVLHIYHAGAYVVKGAMETMEYQSSTKNLIMTLWKTKAGRFGNSSQNYSQLVLAANVRWEEMEMKTRI